MGRKQQEERKKEKENIKEKNKNIKYKNMQDDGKFFKKLAILIVGGILASLVIQALNSDWSSPVTASDSDKKQAHRDVFRYQQEVTDSGDPEFVNDEESAKEIIGYFQNWTQVKMDKQIHYENRVQFKQGHLGLKNDYKYCHKSDLWKLQHPESIYENYYMLTDFAHSELPRQIAKDFGYDVLPKVYMGMNPSLNNQRLYDVPLKTTLINSRISRFHHFHPFAKCLFCVFQSSNHVPGKWAITGKDLVIDNLRNYLKKDFKDPEVCKKTVTFMPPSYRLYDKKECQEFFRYLESDEYKQIIEKHGIGFIVKAGRDIHRGEGIEIVIDEYERELKSQYQNGRACGMVRETLQAQRYIANPMLYKGRKIEVRIYFFIASTNPLIVYSQNLAHLRMCSEEYKKFSKEKSVHVCNVAIAKHGNNNFVVDFSLDGLRDYLLEEGVISNKNWIEEDVYPQIYRAVTHIVRLGQHDFLKDSRVNENFALDFLLDDESKIWFMENNPNPQILSISQSRVSRHYIMFGDMFELQFKYLRSRFKRLQNVAREMREALKDKSFNGKEFKAKFLQANKNRLEPEFQIDPKNTYHKVYDETLEGVDQFCGNLPEACLYKGKK